MSKHKHHEVAESMDGPRLEPEWSTDWTDVVFAAIAAALICGFATWRFTAIHYDNVARGERERTTEARLKIERRADRLQSWIDETYLPFKKADDSFKAYLAAQGCKCGCQQAPCQCAGGCCK